MRAALVTLGLLGFWEWWRRRARVEVGVFSWLRAHVEPGDLEAFKRAGGTHLVVKIVDGQAPFRVGDDEVDEVPLWMADARRVGLVVEGWGWSYAHDLAGARAEGRYAGQRCKELGIRRFYWDAEHHWSDGDGDEAEALAYAAGFRETAPVGCELAWSSFSSVPGATERAIRAFDVWAPQTYGSTRTPGSSDPQWRTAMTRRLDKGRRLGLTLAPIVTTGDVDDKGTHWSPWRGPDGVLAWARDEQIPRVNIWWGANSKGRMTRPGRYARPLVEDVALLVRREVA